MQTIKAILFDAGDTLNCPSSGNWFLPPGYKQQFKREFRNFRTPEVQRAFRKASDFLDADTEEQEYEQFIGVDLHH